MRLGSLLRLNLPLPECQNTANKRILTQTQGICLLHCRYSGRRVQPRSCKQGALEQRGGRCGSLIPTSCFPSPVEAASLRLWLTVQERMADMLATPLPTLGVVLRNLGCCWEGHRSDFVCSYTTTVPCNAFQSTWVQCWALESLSPLGEHYPRASLCE